MEHRRVRGIRVHTIRASRCDDLNGRRVGTGIAYLHGRSVRTKRQGQSRRILAVDIKRILHGTRRVIRRIIKCRKAKPIAFDFRAVSHVKPDGAEYFLNPNPRTNHRVQRALRNLAPRKRHIDGFGRQALFHLRIGELFTARI